MEWRRFCVCKEEHGPAMGFHFGAVGVLAMFRKWTIWLILSEIPSSFEFRLGAYFWNFCLFVFEVGFWSLGQWLFGWDNRCRIIEVIWAHFNFKISPEIQLKNITSCQDHYFPNNIQIVTIPSFCILHNIFKTYISTKTWYQRFWELAIPSANSRFIHLPLSSYYSQSSVRLCFCHLRNRGSSTPHGFRMPLRRPSLAFGREMTKLGRHFHRRDPQCELISLWKWITADLLQAASGRRKTAAII